MTATLTLTCERCGMQWARQTTRGKPPRCCASCTAVPISKAGQRRGGGDGGKDHRMDVTSPGYRLALVVTNYRLAIEEAASALRMGNPRAALNALERVEAPGLVLPNQRQDSDSA